MWEEEDNRRQESLDKEDEKSMQLARNEEGGGVEMLIEQDPWIMKGGVSERMEVYTNENCVLEHEWEKGDVSTNRHENQSRKKKKKKKRKRHDLVGDKAKIKKLRTWTKNEDWNEERRRESAADTRTAGDNARSKYNVQQIYPGENHRRMYSRDFSSALSTDPPEVSFLQEERNHLSEILPLTNNRCRPATPRGSRLRSDDEDFSGNEKKRSYFQSILDNMKKRKKRLRQLTDGECIAYCQKILMQMNAAADADDEAINCGKPALSKLDMLDFVASEICKVKWKYWFLQEGCCAAISRWLSPLKDFSLPNLTIRSRLLHLLQKIPVTSQDLCGNDLGKVLVVLWRHPEETDENRSIIRLLIQQWVRPLLGVGSNYKEYRQQKDHELAHNTSKSIDYGYGCSRKAADIRVRNEDSAIEEKNSVINLDVGTPKLKHPRVPFNIGYKFKIPPKSTINKNEIRSRCSRENASTIARIRRKIGCRPQRIQKQAYKVSIEGRGLI